MFSVVEVKCKRCGALKLFKDELSIGVSVSFLLTIREDGRVYDACRTAEYVLAYPRETLLKMSIEELCPFFREQIPPYQIENNTFLLRDGRKLPAKSYFVKSDVSPEAYHIVNVISS